MLRLIAFVAVCAAPLPAVADSTVFRLDPASSSITYKVVHKFHEVEGTNKKLQGAAAMMPGEVQVQVRGAIADFDSGNANRDAHMKETVEEARFPEVSLKGVIKGLAMPSAFPAKVSATLDGQLAFHGVTNAVQVPLVLQFDDASHLHAKGEFDVSLDAFKVERPSLMFVKIEDACHIRFDLALAH